MINKELFLVTKKKHMIKNTILSDLDKYIHFLGKTTQGSIHDYWLFNFEFDPKQPWFAFITLLVDLGYLGIAKDYLIKELHIPHKRPRKTKKNPTPQLTDQQKEENKVLSSVRVIVENAICGLKRFSILVQRFRNKIEGFDDLVVEIAAGIWNLHLKLKH